MGKTFMLAAVLALAVTVAPAVASAPDVERGARSGDVRKVDDLSLELVGQVTNSPAGVTPATSIQYGYLAYLRGLSDGAPGLGLPPGRAAYSTFWLASGRRLLGRSTIRHHLTPALEYEGGHVGYDIRPSERRKGYGTLILKLTLEKARELGLQRVMLSCDTDNVGSAKVIEKHGGVLQDQAVSQRSGKQISRYWVEL